MSENVLNALTELARQRQAELDEQITAWQKDLGAGVRLWCGPGCGNCCSLTVNTTLAEAMPIAANLTESQRQQLSEMAARIIAHARRSDDARRFLTGYRQVVGPCSFLDVTSNCTIYIQRPLACRALLATRPPDWCGVNLAELPGYEREAFLTSLDRNVVAFPTHYAAFPQQLAADVERGLVFAMIRILGFGVTGNLPLLVWLGSLPGLTTALAGGPATFTAFLVDQRCNLPFLVQLHTP